MDDTQIIALFFERNEQSIKEADSKYGKLCFHIANRILQNPKDSEECVNDTLLCAWNEIPPTRPCHLCAYLCKIARTLALKKLEFSKAKKRSAALAVPFEELENLLPEESMASPTEIVELGSLLNDFLRQEKPLPRNLFIRRYVFFDTMEEIAAKFCINPNTAKSMLFRTRNRLKQYLRKEGIQV